MSKRYSKPPAADMDTLLKVSVFLQDINDFARMNEIYGRYFAVDPPARTTVQVSSPPAGCSDRDRLHRCREIAAIRSAPTFYMLGARYANVL